MPLGSLQTTNKARHAFPIDYYFPLSLRIVKQTTITVQKQNGARPRAYKRPNDGYDNYHCKYKKEMPSFSELQTFDSLSTSLHLPHSYVNVQLVDLLLTTPPSLTSLSITYH